jgi:dihydropyrimidine dehydrogenase (NAD+) subunit PreA
MNLKVNYAGVEFKNPLVLASATPGWDGRHLRLAAEAGAAGVVPKTIGPVVDWAHHPRCGRLALVRSGKQPIGMVNLELFTTMTRERWIESELAEAQKGGARVIASILAMPDPAETAVLADQVQDTGAVDIFELNVSCPMPASTVGMHIGRNPTLVAHQVESVKKVARLPLSVKLTPNVADMVPIALAARDAGADGLVISNSVRAFAGVDISTGQPVLPAMGGYTGPAIKPIVQRHLAEVALKVDLPISAIGGIMGWREIVEYIMLGATTVQSCTAVMWGGYEAIPRMLKGLEDFMQERSVNSLDEIRGVALKHITTTEIYAKEPPKFALVDKSKCTGCGVCRRLCFYDAVTIENDRAFAARDKCDGCGLCALWCPVEAIVLVP